MAAEFEEVDSYNPLLLSKDSYKSESTLTDKGFKLEADIVSGSLRSTVYTKDGKLYVTFRGTDNMSNWMTDAQILLTNASDIYGEGVKVHTGFLEAYKTLKPLVMNEIEKLGGEYSDITFTGHSLGGALSSLASADPDFSDQFDRVDNVSFNAPRVGNQEFTDAYQNSVDSSVIWVNRGDPVSSSPPRRPPGFSGGYADITKTFHFTLSEEGSHAHSLDNYNSIITEDGNELSAVYKTSRFGIDTANLFKFMSGLGHIIEGYNNISSGVEIARDVYGNSDLIYDDGFQNFMRAVMKGSKLTYENGKITFRPDANGVRNSVADYIDGLREEAGRLGETDPLLGEDFLDAEYGEFGVGENIGEGFGEADPLFGEEGARGGNFFEEVLAKEAKSVRARDPLLPKIPESVGRFAGEAAFVAQIGATIWADVHMGASAGEVAEQVAEMAGGMALGGLLMMTPLAPLVVVGGIVAGVMSVIDTVDEIKEFDRQVAAYQKMNDTYSKGVFDALEQMGIYKTAADAGNIPAGTYMMALDGFSDNLEKLRETYNGYLDKVRGTHLEDDVAAMGDPITHGFHEAMRGGGMNIMTMDDGTGLGITSIADLILNGDKPNMSPEHIKTLNSFTLSEAEAIQKLISSRFNENSTWQWMGKLASILDINPTFSSYDGVIHDLENLISSGGSITSYITTKLEKERQKYIEFIEQSGSKPHEHTGEISNAPVTSKTQWGNNTIDYDGDGDVDGDDFEIAENLRHAEQDDRLRAEREAIRKRQQIGFQMGVVPVEIPKNIDDRWGLRGVDSVDPSEVIDDIPHSYNERWGIDEDAEHEITPPEEVHHNVDGDVNVGEKRKAEAFWDYEEVSLMRHRMKRTYPVPVNVNTQDTIGSLVMGSALRLRT